MHGIGVTHYVISLQSYCDVQGTFGGETLMLTARFNDAFRVEEV